MRLFKACVLSAVVFLAAGCAISTSRITPSADLPKPVIDKIRSLEEACYTSPEKNKPLKTKLGIVQKVDLNGDGLPDFIFSDADIDCEMGASFRHGNGGIGVTVFVGTPKGAVEAYSNTVWGYHIEQENTYATAWMSVGGGYCGQTSFVKATAIQCERALIWYPETHKFDLAPISEARFKK